MNDRGPTAVTTAVGPRSSARYERTNERTRYYMSRDKNSSRDCHRLWTTSVDNGGTDGSNPSARNRAIAVTTGFASPGSAWSCSHCTDARDKTCDVAHSARITAAISIPNPRPRGRPRSGDARTPHHRAMSNPDQLVAFVLFLLALFVVLYITRTNVP